jgi:uncharacterized protein (TIGR02453 family)
MKSTLQFLKQLSKNNNKDWFDENRKTYESCKLNFEKLIEKTIHKCAQFDPELSKLEPKKCLFRINKDVRFSKDKSPYKLNFGASINPGGKKSMIPGYYIHIEPGKSFLAGGCYQPTPELLAAIRHEIDYNGAELKKILNAKDFKTFFKELSPEDKLKTAPKGFEKDHPELSLLQHRHFIVIHQISDSVILDENLENYIYKVFKAMFPLNLFLRNCMPQ